MKIGFIGCGNMASAIMGGIIKEKVFAPADIYGTDALAAAADRAAEKFGIEKADGNAALVKAVDIVVLAVKPQYYQTVIEEIRDAVENQLVITIAPGKTLSWLADRFGKDVTMRKIDKEHFVVVVDVAVSEQFLGWIFALGGGARIIGPENVVERMREQIRIEGEMYEADS